MPKKAKKHSSSVRKKVHSSPNLKIQYINFYLVGVIFILVGLIVLANFTAKESLVSGMTTNKKVLGEDESREEELEDKDEDEIENKLEEKNHEEQKKVQERQREELKKKQEQLHKAEKLNSNRSKSSRSKSSSLSATISPRDHDENEDDDKEDESHKEEENETETELETADGYKIKTKIKSGVTTKIEIERGELKLKYRLENGKLVSKVENETGEEVEVEEDELVELENEAEDSLATEGVAINPISENSIAFTTNNVAALTDFPLSIDIGTNELILSTPQGPRVVTILPDRALQNLLSTGIINTIETSKTDAPLQTQLAAYTGIVKIEIQNNDIVYKIKGKKKHRMLGVIPVNTNTTAFVSANSGTVIAQERSMLVNLVDLISP